MPQCILPPTLHFTTPSLHSLHSNRNQTPLNFPPNARSMMSVPTILFSFISSAHNNHPVPNHYLINIHHKRHQCSCSLHPPINTSPSPTVA